jgi:hypothetical protein
MIWKKPNHLNEQPKKKKAEEMGLKRVLRKLAK